MEPMNFDEEYQRLNKVGFDATLRSFGEANKGFQDLWAEMTDYSKRAFDEGMHAWEQLLGARSFEQAIEVQSQYAKRAYDGHVAEMSRLGEMYAQLMRHVYTPVEKAVAKKSG